MNLNRSRSVKCQTCGEPHEYATFLVNLVGNLCKYGSLGYANYACGEQSASCFKMDIVHSAEWKDKAKILYDYYVGENPRHAFALDPYLIEGTVRGCIHGFFEPSSDKSCHFFNSSYVGHDIDIDGSGWHNNQTWITTTTCVCTIDNCN